MSEHKHQWSKSLHTNIESTSIARSTVNPSKTECRLAFVPIFFLAYGPGPLVIFTGDMLAVIWAVQCTTQNKLKWNWKWNETRAQSATAKVYYNRWDARCEWLGFSCVTKARTFRVTRERQARLFETNWVWTILETRATETKAKLHWACYWYWVEAGEIACCFKVEYRGFYM